MISLGFSFSHLYYFAKALTVVTFQEGFEWCKEGGLICSFWKNITRIRSTKEWDAMMPIRGKKGGKQAGTVGRAERGKLVVGSEMGFMMHGLEQRLPLYSTTGELKDYLILCNWMQGHVGRYCQCFKPRLPRLERRLDGKFSELKAW